MTLRKTLPLLPAFFLLASAGAATVVVNSSGRGNYDVTGGASFNDSYSAGAQETGPSGSEHRAWFTFDLSTVLTPVTAANFVIFSPAYSYDSSTAVGGALNASETFTLYDVSSTGLAADGSSGHAAIFTDLGSGVSYGSLAVSETATGTYLTISLNSSFLSAVNSRLGGSISLGGAITSLDADATTAQFVFNSTATGLPADGNTRLEFTTTAVPEAETGLFVLGAAGVAIALRRRKK